MCDILPTLTCDDPTLSQVETTTSIAPANTQLNFLLPQADTKDVIDPQGCLYWITRAKYKWIKAEDRSKEHGKITILDEGYL
ncbi:unnamed protein product [Cylicocyclus nassatus]|uniref:Uncharacterized protein n=1 Tax=Cylicocyclus nassatus TaxID=53992 RepID=A0AA36DJ87_CYLNA|nr:unnamed protein product [Cylicocyclus nassatus]